MQRRTKKLEAMAHHEAGHAVTAYLQDVPITEISIISDDDSEEHCKYADSSDFSDTEWDKSLEARAAFEGRAICSFAGGHAEKIFTGRWNRIGMASDSRNAAEFILRMSGSPEELETYGAWLRSRTDALLENPTNWAAVTILANDLLDADRIGAGKVRRILNPVLNPAYVVARRHKHGE